ncbi:beta-lactamase family protein [Nostoc sp. CHAB 5834]|nr:beta-lactamase family protein [Nostoc sp. CHAB 5834]
MKKLLFCLMMAVTVSACTRKEAVPPGSTTPSFAAAYTARLNAVFDSTCQQLQLKGAVAAVLGPDGRIWQRAYGVSHEAVPMRTDMALTIGSNTKTYIATLALKLQENGVLSLNDTIGKWIRNKPNVNGSVTLRQLLNQTSGFGDFSYNAEFIEAIRADFNRVWQPEETYPYFEPPVFPVPGSAYAYSDQNLVLAGLVIEAATGKPVEASLRELLLKPANLNHTVYYPFEDTALQIPHSWSADYNDAGKLEDLDATYGYSRRAFCSADNAAGGMVSTAEENVKFWRALMQGTLINQQSLAQMQQFMPTGVPDERYGLGIVQTVNRLNGRTIVWHNGYVPGSVNDNAYDRQSGVAITILTNQDQVKNFDSVLSALHKVLLDYK